MWCAKTRKNGFTWSAPKRMVTPTRAQIRAIIDEADARGMFAFATGLLMQWTYMLRAVDVRGHWLPAEGDGGIVRDGLRWQDGLTWDMIDADLEGFDKTISKTARSMPEPMRFDLTDELRSRLRLLGNGGRIGPVIVSSSGLPYEQKAWARTFARLRDHLGLPKEIALMDTRAGAITEAKHMGATPWQLRDAAQHKSVTTTDGYSRGRSESAATVVQLRNRT